MKSAAAAAARRVKSLLSLYFHRSTSAMAAVSLKTWKKKTKLREVEKNWQEKEGIFEWTQRERQLQTKYF